MIRYFTSDLLVSFETAEMHPEIGLLLVIGLIGSQPVTRDGRSGPQPETEPNRNRIFPIMARKIKAICPIVNKFANKLVAGPYDFMLIPKGFLIE